VLRREAGCGVPKVPAASPTRTNVPFVLARRNILRARRNEVPPGAQANQWWPGHGGDAPSLCGSPSGKRCGRVIKVGMVANALLRDRMRSHTALGVGRIERPKMGLRRQGSRRYNRYNGKSGARPYEKSDGLIVAMKDGPMKRRTRKAKSMRGATARGENLFEPRGPGLDRAEAEERNNANRIRTSGRDAGGEAEHATRGERSEGVQEYRQKPKPVGAKWKLPLLVMRNVRREPYALIGPVRFGEEGMVVRPSPYSTFVGEPGTGLRLPKRSSRTRIPKVGAKIICTIANYSVQWW
jgi:hypothetical protein